MCRYPYIDVASAIGVVDSQAEPEQRIEGEALKVDTGGTPRTNPNPNASAAVKRAKQHFGGISIITPLRLFLPADCFELCRELYSRKADSS